MNENLKRTKWIVVALCLVLASIVAVLASDLYAQDKDDEDQADTTVEIGEDGIRVTDDGETVEIKDGLIRVKTDDVEVHEGEIEFANHRAVVCEKGQDCDVSCTRGDCNVRCLAGSSCDASCAGGDCEQICEAGADCNFSCSGGDCVQRVLAEATAKLSCTGGDCLQACAKDASRCKRSCLGGDCRH